MACGLFLAYKNLVDKNRIGISHDIKVSLNGLPYWWPKGFYVKNVVKELKSYFSEFRNLVFEKSEFRYFFYKFDSGTQADKWTYNDTIKICL